MTDTTAETRRMPKSAATRRRVLTAAATILVRDGYSGARLADIAEAAGLQIGSMYYYFSNKEQLVEEVLFYSVQFTHTHVSEAVAAVADARPGDRLSIAIRAFLQAILELGYMSPAHNRTFDQLPDDMQKRLQPSRRAFGKLWERLIVEAIDAGDIRSDVDPYVLRLFIIHTIEQVPEWPGRARRSAAKTADIMESLIMDGVRTAPTP